MEGATKTGRKGCRETTIGETTVQIIPTRHFEKRFLERVGDLMPPVHESQEALASGILVQSWRPSVYFLDVEGVGRFVLKEDGANMIGVTVLPRIYCHCELGGSSDV